jgi:hypothetical protein
MEPKMLGFCYYCNKPVMEETGFYLNPNPMGNAFGTAKSVHTKCHCGQDEELPFEELLIGLGDPLYGKK